MTAAATPTPRRILITACVMMTVLMQTLDSTIANVALPYMQGSLAASQEEISWVLTSYIVASAIMTAPVGYMAGRFGRTRVLVSSAIGFTLASILCGMSQTLDQIVLFRVIQGLFGALLVPLSQSTLLDIWPPAQHGAAMAVWITGALVGPILGPSLGGFLTEHYNWRWVFYINVPFGLLATAGLLAFLREGPKNSNVRLDWTGFLALSLGVGALQTMLDRGGTLDWFSSREIQVETVLAGLGFYIFATQTILAPKPFLSPRLFKDMNFTAAVVITSALGLMMFATMALLPPYLQILLNYPVATIGMIMAPRGIGAMVAAVMCGKLMPRLGARLLVTVGFITTIYTLHLMTRWTPDVSEQTIILTGFLQGWGSTCTTVPLTTLAFTTLGSELRAEAAGVYNLVRMIASSIGISITTALLVSNTQVNHAIISAAVTPFNRALQNGAAMEFWNPGSPHGAVLLDSVINRQSSIIAYGDDFKLMLVLSIIATPLVLLIQTKSKNKAMAAE